MERFKNLSWRNFHKYSHGTDKCPLGFVVGVNKLEPNKRCNDLFTIEEVDDEHQYTQLHQTKTGEKFLHYTLIANDDLTYEARICKPEPEDLVIEK